MNLHLIHTAVITRQTSQAEDPLGNPQPVTEIEVYNGECRLIEEQERLQDASYITSYKLLLPAGTDVIEHDKISTITLEDNSELSNFTVSSLVNRRYRNKLHHITAILERVS